MSQICADTTWNDSRRLYLKVMECYVIHIFIFRKCIIIVLIVTFVYTQLNTKYIVLWCHSRVVIFLPFFYSFIHNTYNGNLSCLADELSLIFFSFTFFSRFLFTISSKNLFIMYYKLERKNSRQNMRRFLKRLSSWIRYCQLYVSTFYVYKKAVISSAAVL